MSNIPSELQAIKPPASTAECVEIAKRIIVPKDKIEKYTLHLAQSFFRENIPDFSVEEFKSIIKNKAFVKPFIGTYAENIINKCIEANISYPVFLPILNSENYSGTTRNKYISILNDENNRDQLSQIYEYDNRKIFNFLSNSPNLYPSQALSDIVLNDTPEKIIDLPGWSDEKKINWIKDNKKVTKKVLLNCLGRFSHQKPISDAIRNQLYENMIEIFSDKDNLSSDDKSFRSASVTSLPYSYISYAKSHHKEFFEELLNEPYESLGNMSGQNQFVMNNYQKLIIYRTFNNLQEIKDLLESYKEKMLVPIREKMGIHEFAIDPFEHFYRVNRLQFFSLFSMDDNLSDKQKDILSASAFTILQAQHKPGSQRNKEEIALMEILSSWHLDIILQSTKEQFDRYSDRLLSDEPTDGLIKELDRLQLLRELNNDLKIQPNVSKKPKI